jgi:hypothetical protein
MTHPMGAGAKFTPLKMQNTHWYGAGRDGYTSNPNRATKAQVDEVGLHDCDVLGCSEKHAGTKTDYKK